MKIKEFVIDWILLIMLMNFVSLNLNGSSRYKRT